MRNVATERREVFEEIYGVSRFSDVLEMFEKDYKKQMNKSHSAMAELYKTYSYAIFFMYSPSSIRNNLVKFKNIIKKHGGKFKANALEAFDIESVYSPIKAKDAETKKDLKEKVKKGKNTAINPEKVINDIKALKEELDNRTYTLSSNQKEPNVRAYRIVAMLGLATGRRFTELMKTLVIKRHRGKTMFDGLLKGNSEAIEGHIIALSYKDVQKYLKELREFAKTDNMKEQEVNAKYSRVFNNAMKRIGVKNIKSTRHNYSVAGSQLFKREGESLEETITRILGHREVLTSALNYT